MTGFDTDAERELFRRYAATRDRRVRNELVERHMGFAVSVAERVAGGHLDDDVRQAAMYGLVKAVDRFDPAHGSAFTAFAGVSIEGEVKRHFRDQTWTLRVPRRAKELHLLVRDAAERFVSEHGRSPTISELATSLGVERDEVVRGLSASAAAHVGTIDAGATESDTAPDLDRQQALSVDDVGFEQRLDEQMVGRALEALPERERLIVELRFYEQKSQSEIADEVGVSQMHVSRLLRRSFELMRTELDGGVDPPDE